MVVMVKDVPFGSGEHCPGSAWPQHWLNMARNTEYTARNAEYTARGRNTEYTVANWACLVPWSRGRALG